MLGDYPVHATDYRGYAVVYDDRGADIWIGGNYIDTQYSNENPLAKAKRIIDGWLDAP